MSNIVEMYVLSAIILFVTFVIIDMQNKGPLDFKSISVISSVGALVPTLITLA